MAFDMVKYSRGQVWIIRWKNPTQSGHEQMKDRPWLILSVDKFNQSSGMVTAVPLTTRDYVRTPAQVLLMNERGKNSVILCEQVRSFDYNSGDYIFDYKGTVSDSILEKVDVAMSVHLGMHYSPITLKNLYETMESIIKSVGYMQQKESSPKFTDADVQEFTNKLKELATPEIPEKHESFLERQDKAYGIPHDYDENYLVRDLVAVSTEDDPKESKSDSEIQKIPRMKWTPEKCQEFMHDADTMPMVKVMEKWNILKKTRFYSMKNYVRNLLEEGKD